MWLFLYIEFLTLRFLYVFSTYVSYWLPVSHHQSHQSAFYRWITLLLKPLYPVGFIRLWWTAGGQNYSVKCIIKLQPSKQRWHLASLKRWRFVNHLLFLHVAFKNLTVMVLNVTLLSEEMLRLRLSFYFYFWVPLSFQWSFVCVIYLEIQ